MGEAEHEHIQHHQCRE
ncbi:unnamed protein product [Spirodela intermedia]|uniref:Uncharacterized protein n=1 Tax=Spirodela intermedia TaxID=51605 RepID=A0A7I8KU11_SPIIN|nr:unnamed protein product [Spirodela intermedia]